MKPRTALICVLIGFSIVLVAFETQIRLTTQVQGILPVANGGTGGSAAGNNGQVLISNGSTFAPGDPLVSGPTAIGAAPSTNPVFVCTWDGTNIRCPLTQNAAPGATDYGLTVRNIPSGTQTVSGTVTANAGSGTFTVSGTVTANAGSGNFNTNLAQIAGTATVADPCQVNAKTYDSFSITANTQIITGTSAKKIFFCNFHIVVGAATNVAVVEGTGSVCATGIAKFPGLSGGTTAAGGWNFAANGGLTYGSGQAAIAGEGTNADNVCILVSAANQTSGGYSYVVQ